MKLFKNTIGTLFLFITSFTTLESTPSTVFWTPCTTDVYPTGTGHIDVDNYFTVFNRRNQGSSFPPGVGFEIGAFNFKDCNVETGFDYLGGTDNPLFFNIGVGLPEDKIFYQAPSFKVGFFNAGTSYRGHEKTNYNIVDVIFGKTIPDSIGGGRFCIGGFSGNHAMGKNKQGFMISYQRSFSKSTDSDNNDYFKWVVCADYASGKNIIGGGGFGVYYYFTKDISILTGPVWFNSTKINGHWKWSIQIDISFSVFTPKKMV